MKVAVAVEQGQIAPHFGHCEGFELYQLQGGNIIYEEYVANPGHKPGFLPNFLGDQGVTAVVVGGIGQGAIEIFQERGIEIFQGISGLGREAVQAFAEGKLESGNSTCDH